MKVDDWQDLIELAKKQGLTPKEAWERIEKTNLKFLNRKSTAEQQLKKGTRIQQLLFPKIKKEENIIYAKNLPSLDVSGDFYNFKHFGDKVFIVLGDVSGKGVDAGLIMTRVTTMFEILVEEKKSVREIVSLINNDLYTLVTGKFLTAIFGCYDKKSNNFEFVNAGHSNCIILDNNKTNEHMSNKIPPLGVQFMKSDKDIILNQISLDEKIFYILSDGLSESKDFTGKELEINGVIKLIDKNRSQNIQTQLENIFIEISAYGALQNIADEEKSIIKDDTTILAINGKTNN